MFIAPALLALAGMISLPACSGATAGCEFQLPQAARKRPAQPAPRTIPPRSLGLDALFFNLRLTAFAQRRSGLLLALRHGAVLSVWKSWSWSHNLRRLRQVAAAMRRNHDLHRAVGHVRLQCEESVDCGAGRTVRNGMPNALPPLRRRQATLQRSTRHE